MSTIQRFTLYRALRRFAGPALAYRLTFRRKQHGNP